MGQRSQIYIRFNYQDKRALLARYFQWNCGGQMISRARWLMEEIHKAFEDGDTYFKLYSNIVRLTRYVDVNFDTKDIALSCDIIDEWIRDFQEEPFNKCIFKDQDNNDGKLLIDVGNHEIKYAFLNQEADPNSIMDATNYMEWDSEKWEENEYISDEGKAACKENISEISQLAILMTTKEVEEFINYEYDPFILHKGDEIYKHMKEFEKLSSWKCELRNDIIEIWIPWKEIGIFKTEEEAKAKCLDFKDGMIGRFYPASKFETLIDAIQKKKGA